MLRSRTCNSSCNMPELPSSQPICRQLLSRTEAGLASKGFVSLFFFNVGKLLPRILILTKSWMSCSSLQSMSTKSLAVPLRNGFSVYVSVRDSPGSSFWLIFTIILLTHFIWVIVYEHIDVHDHVAFLNIFSKNLKSKFKKVHTQFGVHHRHQGGCLPRISWR